MVLCVSLPLAHTTRRTPRQSGGNWWARRHNTCQLPPFVTVSGAQRGAALLTDMRVVPLPTAADQFTLANLSGGDEALPRRHLEASCALLPGELREIVAQHLLHIAA